MAACALRISGIAGAAPTGGRAVAVEPQSVRHVENGNCWIGAYPCPSGACPGVCDRCHAHDQLRAACTECAACPFCGRSET